MQAPARLLLYAVKCVGVFLSKRPWVRSPVAGKKRKRKRERKKMAFCYMHRLVPCHQSSDRLPSEVDEERY